MRVGHFGAFLGRASVTPVDANGCDMCLSRENGPHWLQQLPGLEQSSSLD